MSASKALTRVAVVGTGYYSQFHLEGWAQQSAATVVGLCDLRPEPLHALAQRFGVTRTFSDAQKMFDEQRPDLVDVVLPPAAQAPVVQAALQRGIAVICQKPFGRDLAEAQAMAQQAADARVPLVVHENFRFTPWFREARRLITSGHLGQLHSITFRLRPGDGQGSSAYLERQPYFQTMPRLLVVETAIHFIDSFRYLMGEVAAVTARLRRLNPAIQGEDAALILFEFESGASGLFDGNRLNGHVARNPRRTMGEMWLEGSAGVLRLDGESRLWWLPHGATEEAQHHYDDGGAAAFGGASGRLQGHVLSHLRDGGALENSAADYLANLRVQEAIYHSHACGQRVAMATFNAPATPAPITFPTSFPLKEQA